MKTKNLLLILGITIFFVMPHFAKAAVLDQTNLTYLQPLDGGSAFIPPGKAICGIQTGGLDNKGTIMANKPILCSFTASAVAAGIGWSGTLYTRDSAAQGGTISCDVQNTDAIVGVDYAKNFQADRAYCQHLINATFGAGVYILPTQQFTNYLCPADSVVYATQNAPNKNDSWNSFYCVNVVAPPTPTPTPTCSITSFTAVNPTPPYGQTTDLSFILSGGTFDWHITDIASTSNGNVVTPSNGNGASGTVSTSATSGTQTYTLTCNDGVNNPTLDVSVVHNSPPKSVDIKAAAPSGSPSDGPISINSGDSATISWTSQDVSSCIVSPTNWTGTSNTGISTGALTSNTTYSINCDFNSTTNSYNATDSVTVNVTFSPTPTPTPAPILSATLQVSTTSSTGPWASSATVTAPLVGQTGPTLWYRWSSTGAADGSSKASATPSSCPGQGTWVASGTSGSTSGVVSSDQAGCTYSITYTVQSSTTPPFSVATSTITVTILTPSSTPPPGSATGTISASPNPCTIFFGSTCQTNLSWSTTGATVAQVWVSDSGGAETLFASGTSGNFVPATWIFGPPHYYDFNLYDYSSGGKGARLATVRVTATASATPTPTPTSGPQAIIQCNDQPSPADCTINEGESMPFLNLSTP